MSATITAMTYNVRYENANDESHEWSERCDDVANVLRFHDPDVVGLQEVDHPQVADLRERLDGFGWLAAGRPEDAKAGELATIAYDEERFDVAADGEFWLSETPDEPGSVGWDAMLPRLVRWAKFVESGSGVAFYHFNTHFDHAGEWARTESVRLLRERVDDLASDRPVVVTGDFNLRASTEAYERLVDSGESDPGPVLRDAEDESTIPPHGPDTTMTDFNDLVPDKKIDYVFASPEVDVAKHGILSGTVGGGRYPSDHLPILVRVDVPDA